MAATVPTPPPSTPPEPPRHHSAWGIWWWAVIVILIIIILGIALGFGGRWSPRDHNLREQNAAPAQKR